MICTVIHDRGGFWLRFTYLLIIIYILMQYRVEEEITNILLTENSIFGHDLDRGI